MESILDYALKDIDKKPREEVEEIVANAVLQAYLDSDPVYACVINWPDGTHEFSKIEGCYGTEFPVFTSKEHVDNMPMEVNNLHILFFPDVVDMVLHSDMDAIAFNIDVGGQGRGSLELDRKYLYELVDYIKAPSYDEASKRLQLMLPEHPEFADDIFKDKVYLYDASLFNNEDENLNNGIYDQPAKYRPLNEHEKKLVHEVERNEHVVVFYVVKEWRERGLFYRLCFVENNDRWEEERKKYDRGDGKVIGADIFEVNTGYDPEDLSGIIWYRTHSWMQVFK